MKKLIIVPILLFLTSCAVVKTDLRVKKSPLIGKWKIAKTLIDEKKYTDYPNRIIEFNSDGTLNIFADSFLDSEQTVKARFSLMDRENMVFLHQNIKTGEFYPFPYRYKYSIKNDTLHFKGFFINKNAKGLTPYLNEEWWVKVK
ncbi:hypothetical protein EMN47_10315 [Prolixibacteraceae bacterium JC049]|nr:hypothetical protein [Prolixibacteraceae bacterium JC049]